MDNTIFFKWEGFDKDMATRYLLYELSINKPYARKQEISWADIKNHIFKIIKEISEKTLFKYEDKDKSNYNLLEDYDDTYSLCVCPTGNNGILNFRLLSSDEKSILQDDVTDENIKGNSSIATFFMGLISHKDAIIFKDGSEKKIWDYTGDNAGILYKTPFGIIISDKLEKIIIIKKSDMDFSIGLSALLNGYLPKKSSHYRTLNSENTIRVKPFVKDRDFNQNEIVSLFGLDISINAGLVKEYREKTGKNDLLYNVLNKMFSKSSRSEKKLGFNIEFSEDGDTEAIEIFNDIYSSFLLIQGEEIEKIFNRFKIDYENNTGQTASMNFKRHEIYKYESETEKQDFEHIFDAFTWLKNELNKLTDS